ECILLCHAGLLLGRQGVRVGRLCYASARCHRPVDPRRARRSCAGEPDPFRNDRRQNGVVTFGAMGPVTPVLPKKPQPDFEWPFSAAPSIAKAQAPSTRSAVE